MNRLIHRSTKRRIGPYLTRKASTVTALGALCVDMTHGQVGVESATLTNNAAVSGKPLKMAANGPIQFTIGSPASTKASRDLAGEGPNCTGPMRSHSKVTVPVGKSTMVQLPEPVQSRTVDNPNVMQAMLVSPQMLYMLGLEVGSTNMVVQDRSGSCSVVDVAVSANPDNLQSTLRKLMSEARNVQVSTAAGSLVLGGSVSDSVQAQRVVDIANAFVVRRTHGPGKGDQNAADQGGQQLYTIDPGVPLCSPYIINVMTVEAPQRVILKAKMAEVPEMLIDQMGVAFSANDAFGNWSFGAIANLPSGSSDIVDFGKANHLPLKFALNMQKGDSLVEALAEPSPMAISRQEASFLTGGKVFIPVTQGTAANGVATIVLQEETFDVGLHFTPTVIEDGRVNLRMSPEVSELSPTGVAVTVPDSNDMSVLPLVTTRCASTTLQVHDNQSFAIGGLIKNNIMGNLRALPGIGELPIIGSLARSTSSQQDQIELLFVVTPRLVKPLPAQYPFPTDNFGTINRGELYLNGNMEGHVQAPVNQPTAAIAPAANPEEAAAEPAATPEPPARAPTPTSVPTAPAAPITPVAPVASAAPCDTRRFITTGE